MVLGALRAAMSQLDSWTLTALWISGYTALALYVLTGASYFVAASYAHFGWSGENRWVKRSFRTITALIALAVPYVVDGLASQAITAALK